MGMAECRCAVATMRLFIIGVLARCPTHQSGFDLLVSNGNKKTLMTTALTDRALRYPDDRDTLGRNTIRSTVLSSARPG
jgi:hypothetical protein